MSCPDISAILLRDASRLLGDEIYRQIQPLNMFGNLVEQKPWLQEMSDTQTTIVYDRLGLEDNDADWTEVDVDEAQACLPTIKELTVETSTHSFNLFQSGIKSPKFCVAKLRNATFRNNQLQQIIAAMSDVTAKIWRTRLRKEYVRLNGHKTVAASGFPESASTASDVAYPATAPTYTLTDALLQRFYNKFAVSGAVQGDMGKVGNAPVYGLILGQEANDYLLRGPLEFRQDVRWSSHADMLLASIATPLNRKGYAYIVDPLPRRFTFNGAVYTEVQPYNDDGTTNDAYETAPYEEAIIFNRQVYLSRTPGPTDATGMKFPIQNYIGDFLFRNIPNEACNPYEDIGFFLAKYVQASQPVFPQYGASIIYQRCQAENAATTCVYGT